MLSQISFFIIAAVIIVFSILTVTSRQILRSAVYLLFVLVATAVLYLMMQYNFLAAVQLTIYVGGILVLIIFSILLTSHISERTVTSSLKYNLFSALATLAGAILSLSVILNFNFIASTETPLNTDVKEIGRALVSYQKDGFALPFEVISILLLAAMIGAIVVARREKTTMSDNKEISENPNN